MELIGVIVIAISGYLYWKMFIKKKHDIITVQDLVGKHAEVFPHGIIKSDTWYRSIVEIHPNNFATLSDQEKSAIWVNFRVLLNTLGIPFTMYIQSRFIDIKDYCREYKESFENNHLLTEEMKISGRHVEKFLQQYEEKKQSRDIRSYIIFQLDPRSATVDSGIKTGVATIDDLLAALSPKEGKITDEEQQEIAFQILDEAVQYVFQAAETWNMMYRQLDRAGVYEMVNSILQKDSSNVLRLQDASDAQSFTPYVDSLTTWVLKEEEKHAV